jgi:hypothetical protein
MPRELPICISTVPLNKASLHHTQELDTDLRQKSLRDIFRISVLPYTVRNTTRHPYDKLTKGDVCEVPTSSNPRQEEVKLLNECNKVKSGSGILKYGELSLNVITEFNRGQNTTKTILFTVAV